MRLIALALPFALLGCTQFPELDGAISASAKNADYPALAPTQTLIARSAPATASNQQTVSTLNARVAALQNRAARLRGNVVDAKTRQRMRNGVN